MSGNLTKEEAIKANNHIPSCIHCRYYSDRAKAVPTAIYRLNFLTGNLHIIRADVKYVTKSGRYACSHNPFNGFNPSRLYQFQKYSYYSEYYTTPSRLEKDITYLVNKYKPRQVIDHEDPRRTIEFGKLLR